MTLLKKLEEHWLASFFVIVCSSCGLTWVVLDAILVKPLHNRLDETKERLERKERDLGMRIDEVTRQNDTIIQLSVELNKIQNLQVADRIKNDNVEKNMKVEAEPITSIEKHSEINNKSETLKKPKLEWSFWAYYGRYKNEQFNDAGGPSFFIDERGKSQKKPDSGDLVTARAIINARSNSSLKSRVLGVICPDEIIRVSEVKVIKSTNKGEYVWIRGYDKLWKNGKNCGHQ